MDKQNSNASGESASSSGESSAWNSEADGDFVRMLEDLWSQLPLADTITLETAPKPIGHMITKPNAADDGEIRSHTFGRFQIIKHLGRGQFGAVVLAKDPLLDREVALKIPAPEALGSMSGCDRFLREARALATAQHDNIITIHDAGIWNHIPFLVMEYCEHGSLAEWLHNRKEKNTEMPPCRWSARLVALIADGMQHAHDRQILHRDLKPGNILLKPAKRKSAGDTDGEENGDARQDALNAGAASDAETDPPLFTPLVADFGLAKIQNAAQGAYMTAPGNPIGTYPYMSPESARGDAAVISYPADVYSLGVILYELLTGRRPFQSGNVQADIQAICEDPPPPPRKFRRDIPRDLEFVCLKCLEKSPHDRYPSPKELAGDLRLFLNRKPVTRRRKPVNARIRVVIRNIQKRPQIKHVSGLSLCVLVIIIFASLVWLDRARKRDAVELLFTQVQSVRKFADLEPFLDPLDQLAQSRPALIPRIQMLATGEPVQKFAADWVFATTEPLRFENCLDTLLNASPEDISVIARFMDKKTADQLEPRLERERTRVVNPARCANAAIALLTLGKGRFPWSSYRFDPFPEMRTILIHLTIPAGVDPNRIVDQLTRETDPGVIQGLILALGDIPDDLWPNAIPNNFLPQLRTFYETHPDHGVHGAAKWLMSRKLPTKERATVDARLIGANPLPGQGWRISRTGLTFIRIPLPNQPGFLLEISDTETPVALFRRFSKTYQPNISPDTKHPDTLAANAVSYTQAVAFCNWLSKQEGIPQNQWLYEPTNDPDTPLARVPYAPNRIGFGLPTVNQFRHISQCRSQSRHFLGDSPNYLALYAWLNVNANNTAPVAFQRPNEFGIFDAVGNVREWCEPDNLQGDRRNRPLVGFSFTQKPANVDKNATDWMVNNAVSYNFPNWGFRIARIIPNPNPGDPNK